MSNVLDHEKQQQILALGRLGWTLRRIEEATGIRRETVRLSASRRRGSSISGWPAERVAAKTGHHAGGVHRLRTLKHFQRTLWKTSASVVNHHFIG
jgi:hypothetical protein